MNHPEPNYASIRAQVSLYPSPNLIARADNPPAPVASTALGFTSVGQIASLAQTWNGSSLSETLTYNSDHQRASLGVSDTSFTASGLTPASATYATNSLNQYSSVAGVAKTYDKRGNLTGDGTWTYAYDAENRLISATAPTVNRRRMRTPVLKLARRVAFAPGELAGVA